MHHTIKDKMSRGIMRKTLPVLTLALSCLAAAQQAPYSPPVSREHPRNLYWGDTHLHTELSGDAYVFGTRTGPDLAYRFAKGEQVVSTTGQPVKLRRPLDFLVVADHANNLGANYARGNYNENPGFRESALGKLWQAAREEILADPEVDEEQLAKERLYTVHREGLVSVRHDGFRGSVWESIGAMAERHNDPGKFTAFIGYEWTPSRGAVHRVVVFRDDSSKTNQILPFSSYDSMYVEDLWNFMGAYERDTGGSVLAIPHNPNLSSGLMFDLEDSFGEPITAEYGRIRSRWEPLLEVAQLKGDSETHPQLSPEDEFADFETWNGWGGVEPNPNRPDDRIQHEYARSALKLGLGQQATQGVNPFKFGMIGSTDSHTALSTADENNFFGKFAGRSEPSAERMMHERWGWEAGAAGYAAVWAESNTREAIFDAMRRRETYATTGPRILLRFFGGWEFEASDIERHDYVEIGYRKGVPMGSDLTDAPAGASPTFMIDVAKDPNGAKLDRVQVVKGWRTESAELEEKVFDVAWSGVRTPGADGRIPPVGSTVDVEDASYLNSIGAVQLAVVWRDPEFNPAQQAFYYVRALEIPTPRWTAYDAKYYGLKDLDPAIPMSLQERAYSSPIWYTP